MGSRGHYETNNKCRLLHPRSHKNRTCVKNRNRENRENLKILFAFVVFFLVKFKFVNQKDLE